MKTENKKVRPFGFRDKVAYMLGDFGCNAVMSMASSFLLIFYTKVMGVSGAIVGTLFMIARFVDAFTDMGMGRIVDTFTFKNGDRFRPWISMMAFPLVVLNSAMYNYLLADAAMGVKIAWLIITYLLFGSIFYTGVNIPYGAMSNVITDDAGQRASLSTWRNVGTQIAGLILGIMIPMVVYVKDEAGNSVASGSRFFMTSLVLGIIALISLLICKAWSIERIKEEKKKEEEKKNTGKVILLCFKDKAILTSFGFSIFVYASSQVFMTFNQYLFLDYFKNTSLSGLASLVLFFGMMSSAPFASVLSKKFGKKEVSTIGLIMSSVAYVFMFVTRVTNPLIYFVLVFVAFFGLGLVTMVSYAMINDCIDNHYLESGDRVDGTVYALMSFVRKMAGAICTGLGGWGLSWIGYNETAVTQTEEVSQGIFNISIGLPTICFILSIIFMVIYPLNKKRVEENTIKLAELRGEK